MAAVALVLYRNWRYEQELDSLLWKVNYKDIQIKEQKDESSGINEAPTKCNSKVNKPVAFVHEYSFSTFLSTLIPIPCYFSHLPRPNWSRDFRSSTYSAIKSWTILSCLLYNGNDFKIVKTRRFVWNWFNFFFFFFLKVNFVLIHDSNVVKVTRNLP